MKRSEIVFVLLVFLVLLYWVLIITIPDFLGPISILIQTFDEFSIIIGYPGAFLVSLIGNSTVLIPFPYIIVPFFLGAEPFNPWITGLLAGFGAMIGEMVGYYAGYVGRRFIEEQKVEEFSKYLEERDNSIPFLIWFLALTPIPDDFMIVPLGAAKYPWKRVFIPGLIGKTMFLTGIAFAGYFGLDWIQQLFTNSDSIIGRSLEVIAILLVIVMVFLVTRIDWASSSEKRILRSVQSSDEAS
jgi:membrane protein YqaA with SNARE-associated domain